MGYITALCSKHTLPACLGAVVWRREPGLFLLLVGGLTPLLSVVVVVVCMNLLVVSLLLVFVFGLHSSRSCLLPSHTCTFIPRILTGLGRGHRNDTCTPMTHY